MPLTRSKTKLLPDSTFLALDDHSRPAPGSTTLSTLAPWPLPNNQPPTDEQTPQDTGGMSGTLTMQAQAVAQVQQNPTSRSLGLGTSLSGLLSGSGGQPLNNSGQASEGNPSGGAGRNPGGNPGRNPGSNPGGGAPGGNPGGGGPGLAGPMPNPLAPTRIPIQGKRRAPTFNGVLQYLHRYFANVERVFQGYHADDMMLISAAIEYLNHDIVDLWEAQTQGNFYTWQMFQAAIQVLYLGLDRQQLYSVMDLERIVEGTSARGIFTRGDLGKYHCQFIQVSSYLLQHILIELQHVNQLYIAGFGPTTHRRIEQHLSIRLPDHHPSLNPYTKEKVYCSAEFVLTGTSTSPSVTPQLTLYPSAIPLTSATMYPPQSPSLPYKLPAQHQPAVVPKQEPANQFANINATLLTIQTAME